MHFFQVILDNAFQVHNECMFSGDIPSLVIFKFNKLIILSKNHYDPSIHRRIMSNFSNFRFFTIVKKCIFFYKL